MTWEMTSIVLVMSLATLCMLQLAGDDPRCICLFRLSDVVSLFSDVDLGLIPHPILTSNVIDEG